LRITGEMYSILNDVVQCEKEGIIRQLFIETSVLKLLLLQFEQCGAVTKINEGNAVKPYDVEKYDLVKKLLEDNIAYSHSLGELSRKSGLNDFKLKKGFKELYGTTVFGYLHDLRMAKAQEMLRETERPVAEIAECCGYAYVQSFSTAFKNRYGITPEKYRKREV
jgi:AraC-like DNA-binding protein